MNSTGDDATATTGHGLVQQKPTGIATRMPSEMAETENGGEQTMMIIMATDDTTSTDEATATAQHTDSGHESSTSACSPDEMPSTPIAIGQEQRKEGEEDKPQEEAADKQTGTDNKFYRVRIVVSGGEQIDVQVNESDIIQELYHMLLERDSTCHRTCFKLYHEGAPLDHFTEVKAVPGIKDNAVFRVVEEPYNVREARVHVRHLREVIRSMDVLTDAVNAVDGASLTCLSSITQSASENDTKKLSNKLMINSAAELLRAEADGGGCLPPDWLLPGNADNNGVLMRALIPVVAEHSNANNGHMQSSQQQMCALKQISFSPFNPPPGPRKMKGDVLYLIVETAEDRRFHITCCTRGFFVNATVGEKFSPDISSTYGARVFHSLFDLISDISPHFKKTIAQILRQRNEKHIFERLPTPYQLYQWMVPTVDNTQDQIRADEQIQPHRIGLEDHMPGQIRDWNEELQTTHDMPQTNFAEKLCRDRARFKVHSDFVSACIRGATAVIEGSVHTINPMDEPRMHMFMWNNIFFSLGFDVKDHYKELGGDAAAHASYAADLAAVQAYSSIDDPKLHTSGMAIVDFRGFRVMAQSIIPGILEREQQDSIVYGSYDSGKTVQSCPVYEELLENSAKILKIAPHSVWNGKEGEESANVKLYSSYESKGIVGNDRRHYLMDLLRTFPPDVNFMPDCGADFSEQCRAQGFPREFKHKLVYLRQELIEAFVDHKCQLARDTRRQQKEKKEEEDNKATETTSELTDQTTTTTEEKEGEQEQKQTQISTTNGNSSCASTSTQEPEEADGEEDPDIRLNPDCFSTAVKHAPEEDLDTQRQLVAEAAEFLLVNQLPHFVRNCAHLAVSPIDGAALVQSMHEHGLNMRYLGKLIEALQEKPRLDYLMSIAKVELLCRCARHIFRDFVQAVDTHQSGAAIAHFLNCLVGSSTRTATFAADGGGGANNESAQLVVNNYNSVAQPSVPPMRKPREGRKKRSKYGYMDNRSHILGTGSGPTPKTMAWTRLSQETLWKQIGDDSEAHFGLRIPSDCCDSFIEWSGGAHRSAIIRRFCTMTGVQILLKNYQLNPSKAKSQAPFTEDDICNLVPVVKRMNPRSKGAHNLYLTALIKMQQGFIRIGYSLMQQAYGMMSSIYGPLHSDLASCLRLMAKMAYALSDYPDALTQQHRALLISERCNGIDHHETIVDYINLAHFSFANLCIPSALKLLYRARYLLLLAHGEQHPYMGQIDANIGIILYALQEYDAALKFLNNALALYKKYDVINIKTALLHHMVARTHSCRGEFRTALASEKEAFNIYSRLFGAEHEKTVISGECLRHLTKQAVTFQKHMKDASQGLKPARGLVVPNFQIQQPTLPSVVELLNAFNNLTFYKLEIHTAG